MSSEEMAVHLDATSAAGTAAGRDGAESGEVAGLALAAFYLTQELASQALLCKLWLLKIGISFQSFLLPAPLAPLNLLTSTF